MTVWNEADHPRDDDGKFTYKNGGYSLSEGGVLEGKVEKTDKDGRGEGGGIGDKIKEKAGDIGSVLGNVLVTLLNPQTISTILGILAMKYTASELKEIEQALYNRAALNAEAANMNSGVQAENNEKQKMQNRADTIYGSDEEYNKKYHPEKLLPQEEEKMKTQKETTTTSQFNPIENTKFSSEEREKARLFIQKIEGFREEAYKDIAGVWTIGYGSTENVKEGDKISKDEAEKLFSKDFDKHKILLENVKIPLSTNEKIALTSFVYNVGPTAFKNSTLLKKLNNGDKEGAANEFDKWIYSKGEISKGLINRRQFEKELFLSKGSK